MSPSLRFVTLWTWPDGWRMVRPLDRATLGRFFSELVGIGRYQGAYDQVEDWNRLSDSGTFGVCFFLRSMPPSPSLPLPGQEAVAGSLRFYLLPDGWLQLEMLPGLYAPLVVEFLRHAYDVILELDPVTTRGSGKKTIGSGPGDVGRHLFDPRYAVEDLLQPAFLDPRDYAREDFVHKVGDFVANVDRVTAVSTFTGLGWKAVRPERGESTSWFDKDVGGKFATTFRDVQHVRPHRFVVEVDAPPGDFVVTEDGRCLDLRPLVTPDAWNPRNHLLGTDAGRLRVEQLADLPNATYLQWKVSVPLFGEEAVSEHLGEALLEVGILGRDVADIVRTFERRRVRGEYPESFAMYLATGVPPAPLFVSVGDLVEMTLDLGLRVDGGLP